MHLTLHLHACTIYIILFNIIIKIDRLCTKFNHMNKTNQKKKICDTKKPAQTTSNDLDVQKAKTWIIFQEHNRDYFSCLSLGQQCALGTKYDWQNISLHKPHPSNLNPRKILQALHLNETTSSYSSRIAFDISALFFDRFSWRLILRTKPSINIVSGSRIIPGFICEIE